MKAKSVVKPITLDQTEAGPEKMLNVSVPKLKENRVIGPGSLALRFNIDLSGGNASNFLVDNGTQALIDKLTVKYTGTVLQDTVIYTCCHAPSKREHDNMHLEGIQTNKIRSNPGEKKTSGVNAENKLNDIYGGKYRIRLNHQI